MPSGCPSLSIKVACGATLIATPLGFGEFAIPLLFISHSLKEMRLMTDEVLVFRRGSLERRTATENFARISMATGGGGYANMLNLGPPRSLGDLWAYQWGNSELILSEKGENAENVFELDARDIVIKASSFRRVV